MLNGISLTSIRAFESAARLGSFREAADELNLSASAVSHAIVKLERVLGTPLFERTTRTVRLTAAGQTLFIHALNAFEELRQGIEVVSSNRSHLLRLHCAPSYAAQVLSPRLPQFLKANPGIEVRLAASTSYVRFVDGEFDADIIYGEPQGDDLIIIPLGRERVVPLCSPGLAAEIRTPQDLCKQSLIRSDNKRLRWPDWFEVNGLGKPLIQATSFDRSFLAIDAAANGVGVALESTRLAHREIKSGRLVAPLSGITQDLHYVGHYLAYPKSGSQRRLARRFADWLIEDMQDTVPD